MINVRFFNFIALMLLALFFWPYLHKLKQFDLLVILVIGLAMPIYDFMFYKEKKEE